mgnify:CR=1 FL=1
MWTIVGGPEIRLTCLVGGRLLEDAASAANFATGSEVVVDKKDIHSVGRAEWGRRRKPGPVVKALARAPQPASAKSITRPKPSALKVFVHSRIAELLVQGKISNETFEEWNRETGGKKLPERVKRKATRKPARKAAKRKR